MNDQVIEEAEARGDEPRHLAKNIEDVLVENKKTWERLKPWLLSLLCVWVLQASVVPSIDPYFFSIIMYAGINIILASSLNLVNGYTGQFSMGHAGFMAVGAYVSASISMALQQQSYLSSFLGTQLLFLLALLSGAAVAALAGYLVGLPSLRLKGDYLAIVTLGFGEIIRVVLLNIQSIGGARGLPGIPSLSSFAWVYSLVIVTLFILSRLIASPMGREFLSVREDEIASESMGVNTTQAKVRAFVLGAFFAGLAGGLFAHYLSYLNPSTFDFNKSFDFIIMVVLGGMGSLSGSVLAAVLLTGMREALRPLQEYTHLDFRMIIYSLILILMMILRPHGLLGTKEIWDVLPLPKFLRRRAP